MQTPNYKEIERKTYKEIIDGLNVHDDLKKIKGITIEELKNITDNDRYYYDIFCFNLTGDLNIGSIIRSAVLHGAGKVIIFGRQRYDSRGAVGAANYIDVDTYNGFLNDGLSFDLVKFNQIINDNNYFPVFIEQGGISLEKYHWDCPKDKKLLIIVGNETNGIPENFFQNHDLVSIPQRGVIRSFNVSNALNIAVWDMRYKKELF